MDIEQFREYCMSKKGATESQPFDDTSIVFKVEGKMFSLLDLVYNRVLLKCDPEKATGLREQYPTAVLPGYHMNKIHWNTVILDLISNQLVKEWTDHSYDLVVAKLNRKAKESLQNK